MLYLILCLNCYSAQPVSLSTPPATNGDLQTIKGIQRVAELGLDCMELELLSRFICRSPMQKSSEIR